MPQLPVSFERYLALSAYIMCPAAVAAELAGYTALFLFLGTCTLGLFALAIFFRHLRRSRRNP